MFISDTIEYKQKIADKLIEIEDVFTLINNKDITKPSDMINKNIFPFIKIPNTQTTVKNYICFDYSSQTHRMNKVYKDITVNIGVICHESEVIWNGLTRHDLLAGVIINSFNWSEFLGFELELMTDVEKVFENNYHGRMLTFKNLAPNSLENKVMDNG